MSLCVSFYVFFFCFFFLPLYRSSLLVFPFFFEKSLSLSYSTGSSSWSPSSVSRVVSFSSKWRASRLTEGLLRGPTPGFNGLDASWGVDNLWGQRLLRIFGRKLSAPLQPFVSNFLFDSRKIQISLMHYRKKHSIISLMQSLFQHRDTIHFLRWCWDTTRLFSKLFWRIRKNTKFSPK